MVEELVVVMGLLQCCDFAGDKVPMQLMSPRYGYKAGSSEESIQTFAFYQGKQVEFIDILPARGTLIKTLAVFIALFAVI